MHLPSWGRLLIPSLISALPARSMQAVFFSSDFPSFSPSSQTLLPFTEKWILAENLRGRPGPQKLLNQKNLADIFLYFVV